MPAWKTLLIVVFGLACLTTGVATIIVPLSMVVDNTRWAWLAGLLAASVVMCWLFRAFLNRADRALATSKR